MQKEEDTVTQVLQLVVTVDANIQDCISHEEWRQEIMYAINHAAAEKFPEQAKEKGFHIGVGISRQPVPYEVNLRAAYMDEFDGRHPTYKELRIIEDEIGNDFSRIDNEIQDAVERLKEKGKLPHVEA